MVSKAKSGEKVCIFHNVRRFCNNDRDGLLHSSMMKVLACIQDFDLVCDLMQQFSGSEKTRIMALSEYPKDTSIFISLGIDVLLLDCTRKTSEALALNQMILSDQRLHVSVIYMLPDWNKDIARYASEMDNRVSMLCAPFHVSRLIHEIKKYSNDYKSKRTMHLSEESFASQLICESGIPVHLNGFRYIKTGVVLLLECKEQMLTMKQLYREIARVHNTTASRVEKAIRDAIDHAYREPCSNNDGTSKPTNSQLIHLLYEQMLVQYDCMRS